MEKDMIPLCRSYLDGAEEIRKAQLMSVGDLARKLDITYVTWKRIYENPETASLKTLRKIKLFVDEWNN